MDRKYVLVVGVALTDRESLSEVIESELNESKVWHVKQLWYRMQQPYEPKFTLVNRMLASVKNLANYDYVIVCDDDITLSWPGFLDTYLRIVEERGFALAQPARTESSEIHHPIVKQVHGLEARQTWFVEIGPLFSMRSDLVPALVPFDEATPMGWGLDYAWPYVVRQRGLKMGIVDLVPVEHKLRPAGSGYSGAGEQMAAYLQENAHFSQHEAYVTVQEFPL